MLANGAGGDRDRQLAVDAGDEPAAIEPRRRAGGPRAPARARRGRLDVAHRPRRRCLRLGRPAVCRHGARVLRADGGHEHRRHLSGGALDGDGVPGRDLAVGERRRRRACRPPHRRHLRRQRRRRRRRFALDRVSAAARHRRPREPAADLSPGARHGPAAADTGLRGGSSASPSGPSLLPPSASSPGRLPIRSSSCCGRAIPTKCPVWRRGGRARFGRDSATTVTVRGPRSRCSTSTARTRRATTRRW